MDAAYKSELREINELNFARFDARMDQRFAELRSEFRAELANLRIDQRFTEFRSEIRPEMANLRSELVKWMFLFFTGSALTNILLRR